ncbi:MAG TPA: thiamine phosphate synthase [Caulobacteraceae bacterium]|nr:thiamine phosphate synthase [Caulobacteraceae bacterium]
MTASCRLYLITPPAIEDIEGFATDVARILATGEVAALQVRLKGAPEGAIEDVVRRLGPIARAQEVVLILNDRADLAGRLGCDGVHLGQGDGSVADARRRLGGDRIIGVTCHDSRHLAMDAAEAGADYVAFGAFFPTTTKEPAASADAEVLSIWQETMLIPCVAIGGITAQNCRALVTAGADFLAVSAGVWRAPGGPEAAVRAIAGEIAKGLEARR